MMSDKMREEFEVWVILNAGNHEYPYMDRVTAKFPDGSYLTTWVDSAWIGWQASRAALCVNACAGIDDPAAEIAELKRQRDSLICVVQKYECAFDGLFGHCGSNGVFNHWGRPIDCTALNEAHELSRKAIKGSSS